MVMKVRMKLADGRVEVEVDGKDTKDCFAQVASSTEVFGQTVCGACDSTRTFPIVREHDGNQFFEMRCMDCGAALAFGQKKQDGSLFPKRKGKDGGYLEGGGWLKWKDHKQEREIEPF
jgi:hypothetical protein